MSICFPTMWDMAVSFTRECHYAETALCETLFLGPSTTRLYPSSAWLGHQEVIAVRAIPLLNLPPRRTAYLWFLLRYWTKLWETRDSPKSQSWFRGQRDNRNYNYHAIQTILRVIKPSDRRPMWEAYTERYSISARHVFRWSMLGQ